MPKLLINKDSCLSIYLSIYLSISAVDRGRCTRCHPFIRQGMNVNFCWSVSSGESMCRSPGENVAYVLVHTFPVMPNTSCLSYLDDLCDGKLMVVQMLFCKICSKHHVAFLRSSCDRIDRWNLLLIGFVAFELSLKRQKVEKHSDSAFWVI